MKALGFLAMGLMLVAGQPAVKPLSKGPVQYFIEHCSRCHSSEGSAYTDSIAKRSEASLRDEIAEMAQGPGGEAINGRDLEAQLAHHLAIIKKQPFISFTKLKGRLLGGEITVVSRASLSHGKDRVDAKVVDGNWSATVPSSWMDGKPIVVTPKGYAAVKLDISKSATSHHKS